MTRFKNKYRVESNRLKNYNYSSDGLYFVTICTHNRQLLFGNISNDKMVLNKNGAIVDYCWFDLPNHYSNMVLDEFVVMPNHIHGIIVIDNESMLRGVETGLKPVSTLASQEKIKQHGLSEFVRAVKTFSARRINELNNSEGTKIWQSGFYDRIIRNDIEYNRIRNYIANNPENWNSDKLNGE